LTGFFYTGPDKTRLLRYSHISREEAPVAALVRLCELFPDHPEWMTGYSAVTLYSEYFQKTMAQFAEPYGMLANSVFQDDEYLQVPERGAGRGMTREAFREQVLNGVRAGDRHYVRLFPVWFEFRGNHGTVLTQAKAISAASHLRGSYALSALAQRQLEWVVGRNPFVQSTMWGEGYDYAPQYSAMSGDIVGSLPVGIQTRGNGDAPYWPTENCHNWKEVWVHPVSRWFGLMRDLAGPALVTGAVAPGAPAVELRDVSTNRMYRAAAVNGRFRLFVPEGEYEAAGHQHRRRLTLLPGGAYEIDLAKGLELKVSSRQDRTGELIVEAVATGAGTHSLSLRTSNLAGELAERTVTLAPGVPHAVSWRAKPIESDTPWVALVIPGKDLSRRIELTGVPPGAVR
jgi:hypothetical protein